MNHKRLYRSETNQMLCGVCAGIAEYFDLDPTLVRLGWALFCIMGGSGGHSDAAAGAKLTMIVAPLLRHRIPLLMPHVHCVSTPGSVVDVLVTQYGVAVNPARSDLLERFAAAGIPLKTMQELYEIAVKITGVPQYSYRREGREVAKVLYRDGTLIDTLYQVR